MQSKKHNGIAYTIRKLETGLFSAVARINGQRVEVQHELKRVAEACIKSHIEDTD